MRRMLLLVAMLSLVLSCQGGPDQRPGGAPPPDKGTVPSYSHVLENARSLANNATAAFYADNWVKLEDVAVRLEQTASSLTKASDIPTKHKGNIDTMSADLGKLSRQLRDAAQGKEVNKANEVMTQINFKVREMRLSDGN